MINAAKELLEHIEGKEVDFIKIRFLRSSKEGPLNIEGTLDQVLPMLNFSYDNGWGMQNLHGYIWYADGSWAERAEYDGSEWWRDMIRPDKNAPIP